MKKEKSIRTHWDENPEKWYFSVQDITQILSDSTDVKQYIKKMRSRNPELNTNWGTICTPLQMLAADGKIRNKSNRDELLRFERNQLVTNCHQLKMIAN